MADGLFSQAGFALPSAKAAEPAASGGAASPSLFEGAGFSLPGAAASPAPATSNDGKAYNPFVPGGAYVTSEQLQQDVDRARSGSGGAAPTTLGDRASESLLSNPWNAIKDEAAKSYALSKSGFEDIFQNRSAVGAGKALLGAGGVVFSPLAGVRDTLTRLTGNAEFGDKATLLVPGRAGLTVAAKAVPEVNALNTLVRDIPAKDLPRVINQLERNPTLAPMDVAPNVQSKAMGISTGEPSKGSAHLFAAAERRADEAPTRLNAAFDQAMGPVPDTVKLLDQYKADVRTVGQQQIAPALENTGVVDITPVVNAIDAKIGAKTLAALKDGKAPPQGLTPAQQRLWNLREDLTFKDASGKPQVKDQYFIDPTGAPGSTSLDAGAHGIQSSLRAESQALSQSASGADRLLGGELGRIRGMMVDAIDRAGGGTASQAGPYKQALRYYRDEAQVHEAFDMGQTILSKATAGEGGLANRPEAWRAWLETATPKEVQAAQLGARTAVDSAMGVARNEAAAGRGIPDVRFVRDKMEMLFGPENAGRIMAEAEAEQAKAATNALLTANSKTARSRAAQEAIKPREVGNALQLGQSFVPPILVEGANMALGGGMPTGVVGGTMLALGGARKGAQIVGRAHDIATNNAYARWASTSAPEERSVLLDALRARAEHVGGGKKLSNALATYLSLPLPR